MGFGLVSCVRIGFVLRFGFVSCVRIGFALRFFAVLPRLDWIVEPPRPLPRPRLGVRLETYTSPLLAVQVVQLQVLVHLGQMKSRIWESNEMFGYLSR